MTNREKTIKVIQEATQADKAYLTAKLNFYCDIENENLREKLEPLRLKAESISHKLGILLSTAHDGVSGHLEYKGD